MLPGKTHSVEEVARVLRRRRWLVLLPLAVGAAAAPIVAGGALERYRSEAVIHVAAAGGSGDSGAGGGLAIDQILSRPRLRRIVADLDLYREHRTSGVTDDVLQRMRDDIHVEREDERTVRIGYAHRDPRLAQQVVKRLTAPATGNRTAEGSEVAETGLEPQLAKARQRLSEQARSVEDHQRRHRGRLRAQFVADLQEMERARSRLTAVRHAVDGLHERRLRLEQQRAGLQAGARTSAAPPKRIEDLDAELSGVDGELADRVAEQQQLSATIDRVQASLDAASGPERELASIMSEHGIRQAAYADLLARHEKAAAERRAAGRFELAEPALLPAAPENQVSVTRFALFGAFGGLAAGMLVVVLLEHRKASFSRPEEVERAFGLPVLAAVPLMLSEGERQHRVRRKRLVDLAAAAVLFGSVVALVYWRVRF